MTSDAGPYSEALNPAAGVLDPDQLIKNACIAAQSDCLGGDANEIEHFRHDFETLCHSLNEEAGLSESGFRRARSRLHMMLVTRLHTIKQRAAQPDLASRKIIAPLIGTGLPRSGTTFLHGLLTCDTGHRAVRAWEAMLSPQLVDLPLRSPIDLFQRILAFQGFTEDEVTQRHPFDANLPEECVFLQETNCSGLYSDFFDVPRFVEAIADKGAQDLQWQNDLMKLLQGADTDRRWVLKAPTHLFSWEELLIAFPDSCIFMNHRDPAKVIPSVAGLTVAIRSLFSKDAPDGRQIAKQRLLEWSSAIRKVMHWRAKHTAARIADIHFAELTMQPMETIARLYDAFDLKLTAQTKDAMSRYVDGHRSKKGAGRQYSLAEYGLDESSIDSAFGDYVRHFGIVLERDA